MAGAPLPWRSRCAPDTCPAALLPEEQVTALSMPHGRGLGMEPCNGTAQLQIEQVTANMHRLIVHLGQDLDDSTGTEILMSQEGTNGIGGLYSACAGLSRLETNYSFLIDHNISISLANI